MGQNTHTYCPNPKDPDLVENPATESADLHLTRDPEDDLWIVELGSDFAEAPSDAWQGEQVGRDEVATKMVSALGVPRGVGILDDSSH